MKSTLLRQVSIMTVLAAFSSLAWACPDVPHVVSGIEMHQAMTARILGFDPASTADPYLPPELMNQGVIAQTVDKDLGFDLASTADPYLPPELMNQSVIPRTVDKDLGFDLASTADPYLPPELMNQSVIAQTVDKDLGFDLASTADPYLPLELMNQSVVAGTSVLDLSGSSDLNQLMDPTAAGNTTPYCDWETHMKGFMD